MDPVTESSTTIPERVLDEKVVDTRVQGGMIFEDDDERLLAQIGYTQVSIFAPSKPAPIHLTKYRI